MQSIVTYSFKQSKIFSRCTKTSKKADDKHQGTKEDEEEGWIRGEIVNGAKFGFLQSGPDSYDHYAQATYLGGSPHIWTES